MFFKGPAPLIDRPTQALVLYAAINTGLIGAFHFDTLQWILGADAGKWQPIVEIVIGLAGIWQVLRQRW